MQIGKFYDILNTVKELSANLKLFYKVYHIPKEKSRTARANKRPVDRGTPKGGEDIRKQGTYKSPPWAKRVKKILIDRDMTMKELAERVGCSYGVLCQAMSGKTIYPTVQEKVETYLGIRK